MPENEMTPPKVVPAATVVVFRRCPDGGPAQLLMLQRAKEMRFAGGAVVFPGGKIDPEDRELAAALAPEADQAVAAARIAGIRETLEESGLVIGLHRQIAVEEAVAARSLLLETGALAPVLDRFGWTLDLEALVPFAHWCPMRDGSFDTLFFLADLGTGAVDIAVDATENQRLFWCSARRALELADAGEISLIFPTRCNVERLAQFPGFAETRDHALATPVRMVTPWTVDRDGEPWLTIPDDLGYPVTSAPLAGIRRG